MTNLHQPAPQVLPIQLEGNHSLGIFVAGQRDIAVLMVSGGAQIRAGSHRMQQQLASVLKQQQISSFRFDFPGYGDAEGQPADFIEHAGLLTQVLNTLQQTQPQIKHWVMFGLCDGASAILLNQQLLQQSAGLILLNPWCRAAQNHAKTMVRFYYWQRLCSAEFWQKMLSGKTKPRQSLKQFFHFWRQANKENPAPATSAAVQLTPEQYLPTLVHHWCQFHQPVLLALSENDLAAQECALMLANLPKSQRQKIAQHTTTTTLPGANHTCSEAKHFQQLQLVIDEWFRLHFPA